tara:strand:- start:12234 stop:13487 length:1254 start_codon:yes stop_codon:yes gene_type:complete
MSIKGYWGGNGAYKSASAVEFDIIPELLKGRIVVTNIRGCTLEKCIEQYPEIPDTANVIYIDTSVAGSMDKLQTWFRWAPHGSLIVLDEIQNIHRQAWREKDLQKFILKVEVNGVKREATYEEAEQLGQPYDFLDAFTRHRHFNWDIVFTTPNIKYLRTDIRNTTEIAYRQANGALLGFKGRFKRSMHDADENKPNANSLTQTLKIKQKTFKCYDSTSTGKVQDTRAGTNIFKSPRLIMALACSIGAFCYAVFSGGFDALFNPPSSAPAEISQQATSAVSKDGVKSASVGSQDAAVQAGHTTINLLSSEPVPVDTNIISNDVFSSYDASITYFEGFSSGKVIYFLIEFDKWKENGKAFSLSSGELLNIGYRFKWLSECAVMLYFGESERLITCWRPNDAKSQIDAKESFNDGAADAP